MTQATDTLGCTFRCYAVGAVAGAVSTILLMVLGSEDWTYTGAIFVGAIVAALVGGVLALIGCRPLPGPNEVVIGAAQPAPAPSPSASAGNTTPAVARKTVVQPSKDLPGQADLQVRKGDWKYEKPTAEAAPKSAAKSVASDGQPTLLSEARGGVADDLKKLKGVGPKLEAVLHGIGVFHFDQVAGWKKKEVAWMDDNLEGFKGRVSRDDWVKQAKALVKAAGASGGGAS